MMTDPIADMLTRIRNANASMKDEVVMPASKQKVALADILKREGYISDYSTIDNPNGPGKSLKIGLKYSDDRKRTISGIKRVSTPGLRVYRGRDQLPTVMNGLGIAIVTTPRGVMTDRHARASGVGGEVIAFVA
ncbi:MAG: 30S ribosomal protein S8 [Actinobacteria bacterium]|nr:30S ribosomal protein S8 [Actinomycetota bacterium]